MRKNNFEKQLERLNTKAESINPYIRPTKKVDSGINGKLFEAEIKKALSNTNGKAVSSPTRADSRKWGMSHEIKTGCGELAILDENGDVVKWVFNSDIIIYAPFFEAGDDVEMCSYVLRPDDFHKALIEANLIRKKVSTPMNSEKQEGNEWYYDRMAIQTYKNSNKAINRWYDALEKYGIPFGDYLKIGNELGKEAVQELMGYDK